MEASSPFLQRLEQACERSRSLLCVGLDPDPSLLPVPHALDFNRAIVDATADLACAFKPNLAFYEALGIEGLRTLEATVRYIKQAAPHALVIGDGKRSDIGSTASAYARAMFQVWDFDAITASPYLGADSLAPLLAHLDRGIFVLCRTSNPGSRDFQALEVSDEGSPAPRSLYLKVAQEALRWNEHGNVGLVVGATHPSELRKVRQLCPELPFLVPGIGAQGGDLEEAVLYGTDLRGRRAIINSSRSILYASRGPDFPQAAQREATRLRNTINAILEREGKGWSSN